MSSLLRQAKRFKLRLAKDLISIGCVVSLTNSYKLLLGKATQRGFFCDDESLKYPYRGNTVNDFWLHIVGLWTPLAILVLCEVILCRHYQRVSCKESNVRLEKAKAESTDLGRKSLKQLLNVAPAYLSLYNTTAKFLIGFGVQQFIKRFIKLFIGRLRPHFFAVCQPLISNGLSCEQIARNQTFSLLQHTYWPDYKCTNPNATEDMLTSIHVSFPSGHSSLAFYGMSFLALYLRGSFLHEDSTRHGINTDRSVDHGRQSETVSFDIAKQQSDHNDDSPISAIAVEEAAHTTTTPHSALLMVDAWSMATSSLLGLLLQLTCIFTAAFVALSRIVDYKHHWSDVLAGTLLGISLAMIFVRDCNALHRRRQKTLSAMLYNNFRAKGTDHHLDSSTPFQGLQQKVEISLQMHNIDKRAKGDDAVIFVDESRSQTKK